MTKATNQSTRHSPLSLAIDLCAVDLQDMTKKGTCALLDQSHIQRISGKRSTHTRLEDDDEKEPRSTTMACE